MAMLSAALITTGSLAGLAPVVYNCGAACCQARDHHAADLATFKLQAVRPMSCCSGLGGSPCDLQSQPADEQAHHFQAVPQFSHGDWTAGPVEKATRIITSRAEMGRPPAWTVPSGAIPIYIKTQSILI